VRFLILLLALPGGIVAASPADRRFSELDVFDIEYATDPQIAPGGDRIAYVRQSMDIMTDRTLGSIWVVDVDGSRHRPLLSGTDDYSSPRWSPGGDRLLYVAAAGERGAELWVRYTDTGQTALLTNLPEAPAAVTWSPDGRSIAFQMLVAAETEPLAKPPAKPEGAQWAEPVKLIETLPYRADGAGYLRRGYNHVFVLPADGGTPRQLTAGNYHHDGPLSWSPDGARIVFSANRIDEPLRDPLESELWSVEIASGALTQLTERDGPDFSPQYAPDGKSIAYLGFDDRTLSYENVRVYLLDTADGTSRPIELTLDRSIDALLWAGSSKRLVVSYDDAGARVLARLGLDGRLEALVTDVGSATVGRPYTGGSFSVANDSVIAYTQGASTRPSEVAAIGRNGRGQRLTAINKDLFARRDFSAAEEVRWQSSKGDYEVQGWVVKPPGFHANRRYPLILEIHGGPFAAYGPHFSAEVQLYAAAGYVVLYTNPRGSTSYGHAFANEIHHDYPNEDYDDLMSGVDALLERGYVDAEALFVTGGSGGGILTAWIVGKTDRFRAAVVQKPVVNWASFVLTSDSTAFFVRYWFGTPPWEDPDAYWRRSPLSLVGNVTTPTMLITGEQDFRTPMSESEQYYQALKLRGVATALVRVPERSHNLVGRPSHLIAKAGNILAWFGRYRRDGDPAAPEQGAGAAPGATSGCVTREASGRPCDAPAVPAGQGTARAALR
jgi:acylaminoacyl-peptidase